MFRLQTVGGFGGKSDQLNAYNVLRGDPGYLRRRSRALSRRDADDACAPRRRAYLRFDRRVLLSVVPRGQQALALPGSEPVVGVVMRVDRSRLPQVGPDPRFTLPGHRPAHAGRTGSQVRTVEHHSVPVVTLRRCWSTAAPAPIPPTAKAWPRSPPTCSTKAPATLSAIDVSEALARIGAEFDVDVGPDATMFTLTTLTRFADARRVAARRHADAAEPARRATSSACASCGSIA